MAKFVTHLAINQMIQVRDSIAWVCCASGNVSWVGSYFYSDLLFLLLLTFMVPSVSDVFGNDGHHVACVHATQGHQLSSAWKGGI